MRLYVALFLSIFTLALSPIMATAQSFSGFETSGVTLSLNPLLPGPLEQFTVSVDDYSIGTIGNQLEWIINDRPDVSLNNQRVVTLKAPEVGAQMRIAIRVTTPNGEMYSSQRVISPLYTDIIIEPYTYAPALYRGRSLPSFGSRVLLTALIHDTNGLVNPSNYAYTWSLNNKTLNNGPVRGGFQNTITVPHGRSMLIGLSVANQRGEVIARRLITIPSTQVDIQLYEVSPLFGLSHKAISDSLSLFSGSATIRAVPYNLDISADVSQLAVEWQINNVRQAVNSRDPFEITVVTDARGQSRVQFKLRHTELLLQGGQRNITVRY